MVVLAKSECKYSNDFLIGKILCPQINLNQPIFAHFLTKTWVILSKKWVNSHLVSVSEMTLS